MKRKKIPDEFAYEEEIRTAIAGYYGLRPFKDSNYFYKNFKQKWDKLLEDLESHDAENSRTSIMLILDAARKDRNALFERCNSSLGRIENFVDHFINELEHYSNHLEGEVTVPLKQTIDVWIELHPRHQYPFCIEFTRRMFDLIDLEEIETEQPWKNLDTLINGSLNRLEQEIKYLALLYAKFWGVDSALRCTIDKGKIIPCFEYLTENKIEATSLKNQKDKTLEELLTLGHLVDSAIKLRFLSLTKNERYSQQEAYDIVYNELEDLGYESEGYLPDEAKALADRARRYQKTRLKEIASLSEN